MTGMDPQARDRDDIMTETGLLSSATVPGLAFSHAKVCNIYKGAL